MRLEHAHLALTGVVGVIVAIILLIELGYLDLELQPQESYYEKLDNLWG
ncbi:MAG: hypothetical protein QW478_04180 [Candidatus Micrarchaeaceae archaeon]